MPILLRSIMLVVLAMASGTVAAHDGGADAEGCHHDRMGYHCHQGVAPRPSPMQTFASDRPGSSPGDTSDARRNCNTAMPACGSIEESAHGTGPLGATGKIGEEERGMNALLEAGVPGLLLVLAVLAVLSLYTLLSVRGRRS